MSQCGHKGCRARPRKSGFCFAHDPELSKARAASSKRGGERSAEARAEEAQLRKLLGGCVTLGEDAPEIQIKGEDDVRTLMAATINQVRRGKLSPKVAQVIAKCSEVTLKAVEQGQLDRRLDGLEELTRPLVGVSTEQLLAALKVAGDGAGSA